MTCGRGSSERRARPLPLPIVCGGCIPVSGRSKSMSAIARGLRPSFPVRRAESSSSSTLPRNRHMTGQRRTHIPISKSTQSGRSTCSRRRGGMHRTRRSSSRRRTRCTEIDRTTSRLIERETRLELPDAHPYFGGIDTTMSVDRSLHSLFGVSKASADLMVQEYGRYFDMPDRLFSWGVSHRPESRRSAPARVLVVPHALHRDWNSVHGLWLRREAGSRQHPFGRPRQCVRGLSCGTSRRRRVQHRWWSRKQLFDA